MKKEMHERRKTMKKQQHQTRERNEVRSEDNKKKQIFV